MNFDFTTVLSFLSGSLVAEIVRYSFQRNKDNAETEITLSGGWREYAEELRERLENLEREYWPMKAENIELRSKLALVEQKLSTLENKI